MWKIITSPYVVSVLMLILSNFFMTYAWYGHLKNMSNKAWYVAAIVSWLIAFFEYMIQVHHLQTLFFLGYCILQM